MTRPLRYTHVVADALGIPLAEVYGVTSTSSSGLVPQGRYRVSVCLGTACWT